LKILITGIAGFVGMHLALKLIEEDNEIIGIDNMNSYYDVALKKERLKKLKKTNINFYEEDIQNLDNLKSIFKKEKPKIVIHLAAQAGVRMSIIDPHQYVQTNIAGFLNILELCCSENIKHLFYASSSSVYGNNNSKIFSESDNTDNPISIYAASKKSNEIMAYTYSDLYNLSSTGMRFFTAYGPWGRPDMAYFKFVKSIISGERIDVYGYGELYRDFTYIDDLVNCINLLIKKKMSIKDKYSIYNIGNNNTVKLKKFINIIEQILNITASKNLLDKQPGDVIKTIANSKKLYETIGYRPTTDIKVGMKKFIKWYIEFYNVKKTLSQFEHKYEK